MQAKSHFSISIYCLFISLFLACFSTLTAQITPSKNNQENKEPNTIKHTNGYLPLSHSDKPVGAFRSISDKDRVIKVEVKTLQLKETQTEKLIKIQRLLRTYSWLNQFSGVAIFAKNGQPLHKYTTKYSNLDYTTNCALITQFNTCDITHSFTALAIMQLAEQGKLSLTDTIGQFLPNLPRSIGQKITIHQLLTHTADFKNYYELKEYTDHYLDFSNIDDIMALLVKYPLTFQAETRVSNSPSNYVVLGAIIEAITQQSYPDYLQHHILDKVGMDNSSISSWKNTVYHRAVGYTLDDDNQPALNAAYWGANPFGSDGIYCGIEDLLKYNTMLHNNQLVSSIYTQKLLTKYTNTSQNTQSGYGYGWQIRERDSVKVVHQGSSLEGLSTEIRHYPKDDYTIIIYSNYNSNVAQEIADRMETILYEDYTTVPNHPIGYFLYNEIDKKGIDYVVDNFDALVEINEYKIDKPWILNALGRDLRREDRPEDALAIYKINQRLFSEHPIVYDSLGEVYEELRDYSQSITSFQHKLTYDPTDSRAKAMIRRMKELPKNEPPKVITSTPDKDIVHHGTQLSETVEVYYSAEEMPQFPTGQADMMRFISENLQYPLIAYANGLQGTVTVGLIVDTEGNLKNIHLKKKMSGTIGELCNQEALRLVKSMPRWKPGKKGDKAVNVYYTIPIRFSRNSMSVQRNVETRLMNEK
ncbi:MAG: TonB family protein [Chitinophagales bacterium]